MKFPHEFEALLSPEGRAVLAGKHPLCGALQTGQFVAGRGLLDEAQLPPLVDLLAQTFTDVLVPLSRRLPPNNASTQSFQDTLPKVANAVSVPMEGPLSFVSRARAEEIGLAQMLQSESNHRFCQQLAGRPLGSLFAGQVLANRPLDYAGPHTDHHPNEPLLANGYVDVHLTLCTGGVKQQFIVYERDGHLSAMESISESGTVTAYRLPLWHYTTPLQAAAPTDRRWLVLSSFSFATEA